MASGGQKFPPQKQDKQPGKEHAMNPTPQFTSPDYKPANKLQGKIAVVTGGDSGIGRAVCNLFALEAEQYECSSVEEIDEPRLERVFRTNIFSYFFMTRHALKHMKEGSSIINTTSVNAYKGHKSLIDYTSTKGAIVAFTRALSLQLASKGIRVNGVAPGPIWTPLIPSSFQEDKTAEFGADVPMKRAGQPVEVAPSFVFLASNQCSSYITGQVLHPNGGTIVNA
ncbi:hypothetical protein TSUD_345250 [Trifolium subterraneum]|nr:hypothetical protein TSUD_345250 [Trifolium subterraneum]